MRVKESRDACAVNGRCFRPYLFVYFILGSMSLFPHMVMLIFHFGDQINDK